MKTRLASLLVLALLVSSVFLVGINGQTAKTEVAGSSTEAILGPSIDSGNYTNVILLGWDGVQRNNLFELLNAGKMPNLSAFIQTGKMVNVTVSDHRTDTKAGWTQILTGYRWWKTGVFSNQLWFNTIPKNYTIPERLNNYYGPNQIATAFITGKLNQMEIQDRSGTTAVGSPFAVYSNQALYANLPSALSVVSVGNLAQDRYADVVGPLTLQFLQNNSKTHFFAFFHFSDPDHLGHLYGENSAEYESGIENCDYWLGQILSELNVIGIAQKTLIYITADHGFDENLPNHSNAPYIFFATNDNNVNRDGDEVDVAPTVYYGLGLWNQTFSPALDGYPLQVNLPDAEAQHRQTVLADTSNLPAPSISIADTGTNQKTVTFSATDDNLAAVYLVVDNVKVDCSLTWNYTGQVTASGSYNIDTSSLSAGLHTATVLAFDEHGANNAGPGTLPENGGGPSMKTVSFNVGALPTPSPTASPTPSPSHSPSPSPSPSLSPTSTPSPSPSPAQNTNTTVEPLNQNMPVQDIYILLAAATTIIAVGIGVYAISKYGISAFHFSRRQETGSG